MFFGAKCLWTVSAMYLVVSSQTGNDTLSRFHKEFFSPLIYNRFRRINDTDVTASCLIFSNPNKEPRKKLTCHPHHRLLALHA